MPNKPVQDDRDEKCGLCGREGRPSAFISMRSLDLSLNLKSNGRVSTTDVGTCG